MKKLALFSLILLSCSGQHQTQEEPGAARAPEVDVLFSPKGGCTDRIVALIGKANHSVRMQAYSFTSKPIIAALIAASKKPGVTVRVVLDRTDDGSDGANQLIGANIPVWFDRKHAIAHNKVLLADSVEVETGSFNYTQQAETSNAENCEFIRIRSVVQQFSDNWDLHQSHSDPASSVVPAPIP